jgi:hypothetical protein
MTAITCCGRSWFNDCQICEEKAYADYITEMNNNLESKYVDPGDMEDYEEEK